MPNVLVDPSTSSTATGAIQAYLVKKALTRLELETVYHKFGMQQNLPERGPTVTFFRYTNFTAVTAPLTLDVNPSPTWLSSSQISATIEQWGGYVPVGESLLKYSVDGPSLSDLSEAIGYWAAITIDTRVRNYLFGNAIDDENPSNDGAHYSTFLMGVQGGFSTIMLSGTGAAISTRQLLLDYLSVSKVGMVRSDWSLDMRKVRDGVRRLANVGTPKFDDGSYKCLVDAVDIAQMQQDPEWQSMHQFVGNSAMEKGLVDNLAGVKFYLSQNNFTGIGSMYSATSTAYSIAFVPIFGKEAYAVTGWGPTLAGTSARRGAFEIIRKKSGPTDTSNPLSLYETWGWKAHFVARVLQQSRGYFLVTLHA